MRLVLCAACVVYALGRSCRSDIVAPFTLTQAGGLRTVEGRFPLKRLQFRIGDGAWSDTDTVADEILVRFRFVLPANP